MSKNYKIEVPFSGYSRGVVHYEVMADSEKEALENVWDGELVSRIIVRDDSENEWSEATIVS